MKAVAFLLPALLYMSCLHVSAAEPPAFRLGAYGTYASVLHSAPPFVSATNIPDGWDSKRRPGYSTGIQGDAYLFSAGSWVFRAAARLGNGSYPGRFTHTGDTLPYIDTTGAVRYMEISYNTKLEHRQIDAQLSFLIQPFGSGLGITIGAEIGIPQYVFIDTRMTGTGSLPPMEGPWPGNAPVIVDSTTWYVVLTEANRTADYGVRIAANVGLTYEFDLGTVFVIPRVAYSLQLNEFGDYMNTFDILHAGVDVMITL